MASRIREVKVAPAILKRAVGNAFRCVNEEGTPVGIALMELAKLDIQPKTWLTNVDDMDTMASICLSLYHTSLARIIHKYARDNNLSFARAAQGKRINAYCLTEEDGDSDDDASLDQCYEDAMWVRAKLALLSKDVKWLNGFKDHPQPFYCDILDWLSCDKERNSWWDQKAQFYRAAHEASETEIIEAIDLATVSEMEINEMVSAYAESIPAQFKESATSVASREDADTRTRIERAIEKIADAKYGQLITNLANLEVEGDVPEDTEFRIPAWTLLCYSSQARTFADLLATSPAHTRYEASAIQRQMMAQLEQLNGMLDIKLMRDQIEETQRLIHAATGKLTAKVETPAPAVVVPPVTLEVKARAERIGARIIMSKGNGAVGFGHTGRA